MSFKPIDPKRDEIRRYLERGSVLDSLTKIFIRVIKERPENPMEYIRNNIGVVRHQHDKYERLSQDLQEANVEIQRLRAIINAINPEVLQGQGPQVALEIEDADVVTVAEKVEAVVKSENTALTNQKAAAANGEEIAVVVQAENELAAAVDNCHIGENNVVADSKIDIVKQTSSVQTDPIISSNNTQ